MAILPSGRLVFLDEDGQPYRIDKLETEQEKEIDGKPQDVWLAEQIDLSRLRAIAAAGTNYRYNPEMKTETDSREPQSIYSTAPRRLIFKRGRFKVYAKR